jgi:hypothetical protein
MLKRTLLVAALAALPAAAEARDVIQPSTVSRSATVNGGAARTLALSCPRPAIALNATATGLPSGATVRRSLPGFGVLGWSLELAAAESAASQRLSASLRCLRLALPGAIEGVRLSASTRFEPEVSVPAGATERVALRCGSRYIPTGYGLDAHAGRVSTIAARSGRRGWSFELANRSAEAALVTVSIRCTRAKIDGLRRGKPVSLRFRTRRASFTDTVAPGGTLRHSCRADEFSVATGVRIDPASGVELVSAQPARGRGGLWRFAGSGGPVETQLLCLSRTSTFN